MQHAASALRAAVTTARFLVVAIQRVSFRLMTLSVAPCAAANVRAFAILGRVDEQHAARVNDAKRCAHRSSGRAAFAAADYRRFDSEPNDASALRVRGRLGVARRGLSHDATQEARRETVDVVKPSPVEVKRRCTGHDERQPVNAGAPSE